MLTRSSSQFFPLFTLKTFPPPFNRFPMSHHWNDHGGFTDQSLSSSVSFDPIEASYGPTPLALQQQHLQQQEQQEQDAYNSISLPQTRSVHDSPMTTYSTSGAMDNGMDYGNASNYGTMGGGGSVNPLSMDMDYDLTGVSNVVGGPSSSRHSMDMGPSRSVSMTGLEAGRGSRSQYGTTSAAEAFARLRAGSISITPSSTKVHPGSTAMENGNSSQGPVIANGVPRSTRTSITDIPMRAFSYPARLPLTQASPRQSYSGASNSHHHQHSSLRSPVSSPFPSYNSNITNPPYDTTAGPTYDLYGTTENTAYSLNEGSLSGFNDGIVSSKTTTPAPESYHHAKRRSLGGGGYTHQPQMPQQPQQPQSAFSGPTMAPPSVYASSGFDLIGVLARVVGRKNPVINVGAIDMSCSFIVADAKAPDTPSIYVSETFCKLTGYSREEILGRSCTFPLTHFCRFFLVC